VCFLLPETSSSFINRFRVQSPVYRLENQTFPVQSIFVSPIKSPAEPGQVYFFEAKIMSAPEEPADPPTVRTEWVLDLKQLSDDQGWSRMKSSAFAMSTPGSQ
jgi:hypothetical protein